MNQYYQPQYSFGYRGAVTWAVQRLILINAAVFAVQLILEVPLGAGLRAWAPYGGGLPGGLPAYLLAFQPEMVGGLYLMFQEPEHFATGAFAAAGILWKPVTYMFLHGGLSHLFFNMLWLFFFGPDVERVLGTRQFVRFYLACGALGVLATFFPLLLFDTGRVSVVGASGAVMGVLIAFAFIDPERQLFLFPLPFPINARGLVILVVCLNIIGALGGDPGRSVATHLGGMAVAAAYMKLVPMFRNRQLAREREKNRRAKKRRAGPEDDVGEAVNNIFRFDDRKRDRGDD